MTSTETKTAETTEVAEAAKPKRTRKPAAKADTTPDVVTEDGLTADEIKKTFICTAEGRGGKVNNRQFPQAMAYAVDVADDQAKTPAGKAGLIFRYFATESKAQAFAEKMNADGFDAIVVPATSKEA